MSLNKMRSKKVSLICGDITTFTVDAIVNSANNSLLGGGGLDYHIHRKAGIEIKKECLKLNLEKGGCKTGHAEVTGAGALAAKFVIHAVGPRWLDGLRNEPQLLCDAYHHALVCADKINAKRISFPNISTGVHGFPKHQAAEIAIGTVLSTLATYQNIEHILFVCKEQENYAIYNNILSKLSTHNIEIFI